MQNRHGLSIYTFNVGAILKSPRVTFSMSLDISLFSYKHIYIAIDLEDICVIIWVYIPCLLGVKSICVTYGTYLLSMYKRFLN